MDIKRSSLFGIFFKKFGEARILSSSSALAFASLLTIVPLFSIGVFILSFLPIFKHAQGQIQTFVLQNFLPGTDTEIQTYLQDFIAQAQQLPIFGTIILLISATLLIINIEQALNDIWEVKWSFGLKSILKYWFIIILAPIFAGLGIIFTLYLISLPIITSITNYLGFKSMLLEFFSFGLMTFGLTLLYTLLPNCKVKVGYALLGAFIASCLFLITKNVFVVYISYLSTDHIVYGALAGIPIFLLWLYLMWIVILFGALLAKVWSIPVVSA